MAKQKIVMSTTELLNKLYDDLNLILELRNTTHYRSGRPDEREDYDNYEPGHFEGAWVRWADQTYDTNNRMGSHIGDALAITEALQRWWEQQPKVEGEEDEVASSAPAKVVIEVLGGVAEVTQQPHGVEVEIIDHDNESEGNEED